ncbi:MAG: alpha-glucan family phosphorylase [Chloroflexota bacterium]
MDTLTLAAGFTPLPKRIERLVELAFNLWWSWHPEGSALYQKIDPELWEGVYHNPVRFLREVRQSDLDEAAQNSEYLRFYHQVMAEYDSYQVFDKTWYEQTYSQHKGKQIAYFSAEFGLHESLPIYSGGLGILSGDTTKECSDLGIPLIGVGFLYPQGYFKQLITEDGTQEAIYEKVGFSELPALPAYDKNGKEVVIHVDLPGRRIYAKVWQIQVGNVPIYMMDTDIHPNAPKDRELSARLYMGGQETRLAQEMVLGIGGVRALRQLGLEPAVFHMNEGHSAFLVLERMREFVQAGKSPEAAMALVKAGTVFTTHTPVPAGHDAFPFSMMEEFFGGYWKELGLSLAEFLDLARHDQNWGPTFSMTVLGMRLSEKRNGVSELHGEVTRQMWHWLWPDKEIDALPITHVTNGIHTESWLAPQLKTLYDNVLGKDWVLKIDDGQMWQAIDQIPSETLWQLRNTLRAQMLNFARQQIRARLARLGADQSQIDSTFHLFNDNALTIGFARRFATYKRATLIFTDVERLKRIIHTAGRPVQFIFAGKAHPRDEPGKDFIREVYHRSFEAGLAGHLVFLENYDMNMARYLVSGVDVWMNTPRRPHEASGTSGQKAGLNGIPNFSISDGWWPEAYNGQNGWVIGDDADPDDHRDAGYLYELLENEIQPLFYDRNEQGVPEGWVTLVRESIKTVAPQFSMTRMMKAYAEKLFTPLLDD